MFIVSSSEKNNFSLASFYQSELLNFAVWVLQQDGLQVGTFDAHQSALKGSSELKAFGFDAVAWEAWVREIALSQYVMDMSVERMYPYNEDAVLYFPPVLDGLAVEDKSLYKICHGLLSEMLNSLPSVQAHNNPVAFAEGSAGVRNHLQNLWVKFQPRASARVYFKNDLSRLIAVDPSISAKVHAAIKPGLLGERKAIAYYFVRYPYGPAFYISGSSVILGMREPFSVDDLLMLLKQSSEAIQYQACTSLC